MDTEVWAYQFTEEEQQGDEHDSDRAAPSAIRGPRNIRIGFVVVVGSAIICGPAALTDRAGKGIVRGILSIVI
jgi:hypothetical protein